VGLHPSAEMAFLTVCLDPGDLMNCVQLAREGRLRMVDGDRTDLLPGIDLRVAYDTHSPAFMWVVVRNDEKSESADTWVLAGDLVYVYENISGDERSPVWRKCTGQLHSQ
jgi:N-acyl homoserine lactone hydrolase